MAARASGGRSTTEAIRSVLYSSATPYWLLAFLAVSIFFLYASTFATMISVWLRSATFVHGFLVLPMSGYLIWLRRSRLRSYMPRPSVLGALFSILSVTLWIASSLATVQVGEQFAVIALLISCTWAVLGTEIIRELRFPLLTLFLAVPFGEFLIPSLMHWTANFTVTAIHLTGIPVYLEGNYFSLPSGDFEVVKACSGIRYLIVTVVLGIYFAELTYSSWRKKILFLAAAACTAIVANGIRAYLIVLMAHLSNMQSSIVKDHNLLGWLVFAAAISIIFLVGSRFADSGPTIVGSAARVVATGSRGQTRRIMNVGAAFLVAQLVLMSGPAILDGRLAQTARPVVTPLLPDADVGWGGPFLVSLDYSPSFEYATHRLAGSYTSEIGIVEMHVAFFNEQSQGRELINSGNELFNVDTWRIVYTTNADRIDIEPGRKIQPGAIVLTDGARELLLWHWYDVGGEITQRASEAKILRAWNVIAGGDTGDAAVVFVTPIIDSDIVGAAGKIRLFIRQHGKRLRTCLRPIEFRETNCAKQSED